MTTETDVLIVGAGPVGLTAAIQTALLGASVRIVERSSGPRPWAPALAVHPRTLEVLRGLGVADELLAHGLDEVGLQIHVASSTFEASLGSLDLPRTRFSFILFISQPDLEGVLRRRLAALGVAVEWGSELVALEQLDDEVRCRIVSRGEESMISARYVVGCDGAHSAVRDEVGVDFPGRKYLESIVVADVGLRGELETSTAHVFVARSGILFLFPIASGRWRLIAPTRTGAATDPLALISRHGCPAELVEIFWEQVVTPEHRMAASYREGRVFLAGDAAHVHSPAGAQGMNTGIQDAVNLGWKLALSSPGAAGSLLESYQQERRPVARMVIRLTGVAFAMEVSASPFLRWGRQVLARPVAAIAMRVPGLLSIVARTVSGLDTRYRRGAVGEGRRRSPFAPGQRLPDVLVGDMWLHDLVDGSGFHLLMDPSESIEERYVRRPGAPLRIRSVANAENLPLPMLVRPDGYIAATGDVAAVDRYLDRWLGSQLAAARSTL